MKKKEIVNSKKIKDIVIKIIYIILITQVIYHLIYIVNSNFLGRNYAHIFGINIIIVKEKSMYPNLKVNDIIITANESIDKLTINDVIVLKKEKDIRISRINNIVDNGIEKSITTKGDNNYYFDEEINNETIQGKQIIKIPFIGILYRLFENNFITFIIILLLIAKFIINNYLKNQNKIRRKKREQLYN